MEQLSQPLSGGSNKVFLRLTLLYVSEEVYCIYSITATIQMLHEELIWRNMVLMSHQPLSWSSNKKITSHTCFKLHASSSTLHPCQWLGDTEFLTATLVYTNATWGSNLKKYGFWKLSVFTSRPLLWLVNTLSYKWLTRNVIHFSQLRYLSTLGSSWSEGMWWWINVLYKASANDGKHKSSMTHIQWSDMYWICGANCYAGTCHWWTVTNEIMSHDRYKTWLFKPLLLPSPKTVWLNLSIFSQIMTAYPIITNLIMDTVSAPHPGKF